MRICECIFLLRVELLDVILPTGAFLSPQDLCSLKNKPWEVRSEKRWTKASSIFWTETRTWGAKNMRFVFRKSAAKEEASFCCLEVNTDTWKRRNCLPILFFFSIMGGETSIGSCLFSSCPTHCGSVKVVNLPSLRGTIELDLGSPLFCMTAIQCGPVAESACYHCFHLRFLFYSDPSAALVD